MVRGRPPITDDMKAVIAYIKKEHKTWSVRNIEKKIPEFYTIVTGRKLDSRLPGRTFINDYLNEIVIPNLNRIEESGIDKPWSTATLEQYSIPPEGLSAVLKVWKSRIDMIEKGDTFTIREAKWVSRLSLFQQDTEKLFFIARRHARTELMYDLIGEPFDSTQLDRMLIGLLVTITTPRSLLPLLAEEEDGVNQLREVVKGKSQTVHMHRSIHRSGTAGSFTVFPPQEGGQ